MTPKTAAGRALLDDLAYLRGNYAPMILDIEDEAAASGIVEQRLIQSIEREAAAAALPDVEALAQALHRADTNASSDPGGCESCRRRAAAILAELERAMYPEEPV